ncbi:hypothetical protein ACSBR2_013983 [Camellia fascicularis]
MRGFFKTGNSHKAILVWKEMANNKCMHIEVCYSELINGLCEDGKLEEAMMVWKQMLARGYKPDVVSYSSMIHGLCNAGSVEKGLKRFNEMLCQESVSQPDVITYNILFNALCKQHSISHAIDLLNNMLDQGCDLCLNPPQDGSLFLDELVLRLYKRQRIVAASKIVEVMLQKFLPLKASTWERHSRRVLIMWDRRGDGNLLHVIVFPNQMC